MTFISSSHSRTMEHDAFSGIEPPGTRRRVDESSRLFDVFINHRGPDVKQTVALQLYNSLTDLGIHAFLDSKEKELGDSFPSTIENAIHSASAHIAIFSGGYAESPWCLAELVLMWRSRAKIFPVFYQVKPSDLRYIEKGIYAMAFTKYEEQRRYMEKLDKWKEALQSVSFITGYEISSDFDISDFQALVSAVQKEVERRKSLPVAKNSNGTGCTDINKCINRNNNTCAGVEEGGICHNLGGHYNCSCAKGYEGDGYSNGKGCTGSVSPFVEVPLGACGLVWWPRMHYRKRARKKNFRCNGGDFLMQILPKQMVGEEFTVFPEAELKKASQNFLDVLESDGSGTVYKGILSNGTPVAIKRFRNFRDEGESDDSMMTFINEIVILWSINHENVVKLLGCCLEMPSPVLVYEFVDGGTILKQLDSGGLSWQRRLKIAIGSADALAYLHSELKPPIIHRDIKSSNILLGKNNTPKIAVADFGMSRLLCGHDAHLAATVRSTCGYMDPDYFDTGVLNDKSDVYSFGVFLAELLTGQKPVSSERPQQERVLYKLFLSKFDDDCLTDILDPIVKNEENQDQVIAVAKIAKEMSFSRRKQKTINERGEDETYSFSS